MPSIPPAITSITGYHGGMKNTSRRFALALAALVLLVATAGCSLRKLGYNLAGLLVTRELTEMFDLGAAEEQELGVRVAAAHAWHRRNELPRYAAFLDAVIVKLADGADAGEARWMAGEIDRAVDRLVTLLVPELARVVAGLDDRQLGHAARALDDERRERDAKLDAPTDQYVAHRMKRVRKQLKTWLGGTTDEQLRLVERYVRAHQDDERRRHQSERGTQAALMTFLHKHPGAPAIEAALRGWINGQRDASTEAGRVELQRRADFTELLLAIDRLLTPAQRSHLLGELRSLRVDLDAMMRAR